VKSQSPFTGTVGLVGRSFVRSVGRPSGAWSSVHVRDRSFVGVAPGINVVAGASLVRTGCVTRDRRAHAYDAYLAAPGAHLARGDRSRGVEQESKVCISRKTRVLPSHPIIIVLRHQKKEIVRGRRACARARVCVSLISSRLKTRIALKLPLRPSGVCTPLSREVAGTHIVCMQIERARARVRDHFSCWRSSPTRDQCQSRAEFASESSRKEHAVPFPFSLASLYDVVIRLSLYVVRDKTKNHPFPASVYMT